MPLFSFPLRRWILQTRLRSLGMSCQIRRVGNPTYFTYIPVQFQLTGTLPSVRYNKLNTRVIRCCLKRMTGVQVHPYPIPSD